MWLYYSGVIENYINGRGRDGNANDIVSTPELAFYKDGKALTALRPK